MTAFVKSVEYVEITLTGVGPTSANLTKSQTIADCVPFVTVNHTDSDTDNDDLRVEVFFEAGPKVTAQRDGSIHTIVVGVFVVEFDTSGDVSVQQGTWDLLSSEANTTETITSVTTTKAFVIISHRNAGTTQTARRAFVAATFNSSTELSFDRNSTLGAVTGRYYVVSTAGTDFSVEHAQIAMASGDETTETTVTSVTTSKTFLVKSSLTADSNNNRNSGACVDLKDATTIRSRRAFDSFGGSPSAASAVTTCEVQVVTTSGTEFTVERAECDWGNTLTKAVTVTEIDQTKAIVINGGADYGQLSSTESNSGADWSDGYAVFSFTSDTEVTGTRASNRDKDGTTMFEVVEFVLAGVAAANRLLLINPPGLDGGFGTGLSL